MLSFVTSRKDGESPTSKNTDYHKEISTISYNLKKQEIKEEQNSVSSKENIKPNKVKESIFFPNYIPLEDVEKGLKTGTLIKGILRINQKFTEHSYVESEDLSEPDILITSSVNRNRALDLDEVILKAEDNSKEMEVVFITQKVHPRLAVGYLKPIKNNKHFASFIPRDKRVPTMDIHKSHWPKNYTSDPNHFENVLLLAQILKWNKIKHAEGQIIEELGVTGNLKVEKLALLKEFFIHFQNYDKKMITLWIQQCHFFRLEPREDLRRRCVFTIDNLDTLYMDDGLSCLELQNGNYEIGVHISDVSHYLPEGCELDKIVSRKATTVYLVDTAYHMLPEEFSSLCSLEPGKDKLTFSVFFEITPEGDVIRRRGAKSVISSSTRLNYEQAQRFIDDPDKIFDRNELPPIYNGFTPEELSKSVNTLQKYSLMLREIRKKNCGIRPDRKEVSFRLDHVTGEPIAIVTEKRIPSQEMVEELMLFTNLTVAEKIYNDFPHLALLRAQAPPRPSKISRLKKNLELIGIHIDPSSSKTIQESLAKYTEDKNSGEVCSVVLNRLIFKCQPKGKYVCSRLSRESLNHFGLGFPVYTHFTSPIRRYADVVTHRLLAAGLGYRPRLFLSSSDVSNIANNCNQQAHQAKRAAEASFDLYFCYYIERHQPYIETGAVYFVQKQFFDVVVFNVGISVRVHTDTFDDCWDWKSERVADGNDPDVEPQWKIKITFPETKVEPKKTLVVDVFTVVQVELIKIPRVNRLKARLCPL